MRVPLRLPVLALLVAATIMCFAAAAGVWVNRQVLNPGNWAETSSRLLASEPVEVALGAYLVDELFDGVDVAAALRQKLPPSAEGLAEPAAAGLRELAERAAPRLLARPRVQKLWVEANRRADEQLVRIAEGGDPARTVAGDVTLDLRAIIGELAADLGLGDQLAAGRSKPTTLGQDRAQPLGGVTLPSASGKLVVLRSDQLTAVQDAAGAIRGLAVVLPVLAIALFTLAVWIARRRRRLVLRATGWCLAAVGVVLLLLRRVGGSELVDALVTAPSNQPAAHAVWDISTSLLRAIAVALIVYGVLLVLCAWLAGPSRSATAVRRALAPGLRDHPAAVYGAVGSALSLLVLWGPTPAFREGAWIALFAALLVLGVAVLRRQTALEFAADARSDGGPPPG